MKNSLTCIHMSYFVFSNIPNTVIEYHMKPKRRIYEIDKRLAFLVLFSKNLIAKGKYIKKINIKYFNTRYWIFKYSAIWTHWLCCLLDCKSFDTLSTCFLTFKCPDPSNGLALIYLSRFLKARFCLWSISIGFIIKIINSIFQYNYKKNWKNLP